jgi:hypothetical protein
MEMSMGFTIPQSRALSVGEVARQIPGARPQDITALFYRGELRDDLCPIVAGRRLIPPEYVELIRAALNRRGHILARRPHAR